MLSIFARVCWPPVSPLEKYLFNSLAHFLSQIDFFLCWVILAVYICWILIPYWSYHSHTMICKKIFQIKSKSIIYSRQDMEAIWVPINKWMDKDCIYSNMEALGGHYANWNKSEREDKYCMISLILGLWKVQQTKKQAPRSGEQTSGYQWGGARATQRRGEDKAQNFWVYNRLRDVLYAGGVESICYNNCK